MVAKGLFWGSLGAICWTHSGYPMLAAVLARLRPRPVARADATPSVTVIVAAHDEEAVIGQRLENLLALDYPHDRLGIVVASDASTDATDTIVTEVASRDERVRLFCAFRAGARSRHRIGRWRRHRPRSSPFPTQTPSGAPTPSACSFAASPTRPSPTSAGAIATRAATARTAKASTPGSREGCVRPNRNSDP